MSIRPAAEEVFRFSIVRNPTPASPDALQDGVIRIIGNDAEGTHSHYAALLKLRATNPSRDAIVAYAQRVLNDTTFVERLESLATPLWQFAAKIQDIQGPTVEQVRSLIDAMFAKNATAVVEDPAFIIDRSLVADSLILASVAPAPVVGLRGRMMRALRATELIRRVAIAHESGLRPEVITRVLRATLILPASLFPIPGGRAESERNRAEHGRRKVFFEKERIRAEKVLAELSRNQASIEELSGSLSKHLFDTLSTLARGERTVAGTAVLPRSAAKRLSVATRKVLTDQFGIGLSKVDVPYAVERLETRNALLGKELLAGFGDLLLQGHSLVIPGCGECEPLEMREPKAGNDFTPETRGDVELVGIQDLLIVRQRLREYRAGEIAHIENVLRGERKSKTHRKLERSETTVFAESETEEQVEKEFQTTDKYELQTASSRAIQEDKKAEAGVTVTASYGSVDIQAHGNYANSSSTTDSRQAASTYARDVLDRSLRRIRERVMTRRSRMDVSEVEVINQHEFANNDGSGHINGIYRWVDKFYEAQIVNYGKRTMLEFMIPDPAAFYRHAAGRKPLSNPGGARPDAPGFCRNGVFHPLTPYDLQPENYMCFVGKYRVSEVTPPTPRYVRASDLVKFKVDISDGRPVTFAEVNDSFKLPEGYTPRTVSYAISGGNSHSATTAREDIILAVVTIGSTRVFRYYRSEIGETGDAESWPVLDQVIEWGQPLSPTETAFKGYADGTLTGSFPVEGPIGSGDFDIVKVSLTGHTTLSMSAAIHYTVLCERSQATFERWQIETFNAIQQAYLGLKREYESSLQNQDETWLTNIQGRNPGLNREVEKRELKKFAISLLTGQQYDSFNAMEHDYTSGLPQINLVDAAAEGRFVRFFEQALEWRHLTYLFYPYFWADKKNWTAAVNQKDVDPLFEQFLQAGYARVWVPVRPGFEQVVVSYIEIGGDPWTEKDAPLVEEPDLAAPPMVSLIEEIKEQLSADFDSRPGRLNVRQGEFQAVGTGTDFRDDDIDREVLIGLEQYRIAGVDVGGQAVLLTEPYAGEDRDAIGFAIGVRFVGEPWLVKVPTSLVHLKNDDDPIKA